MIQTLSSIRGLLASLVLLAPQATHQAVPEPEPDAQAPAEQVAEREPFEGSLREGLAAMIELAHESRPEEAVAIADDLLAPTGLARWRADLRAAGGFGNACLGVLDPLGEGLGLYGPPVALRAEVHYAKGVVLATAGGDLEGLERELETARVLAGAGDLRLDAIEFLGYTDFEIGEHFRAQIPELQEAAAGGQNAAPPAALPSPMGGAEEQPDPLQLARAAYTQAREHLVERLRSDWRDADTRANAELVQRRLRELDEIERQREEQQQEQEQQEQQESEDGEQQDPEQQDQEQQDQDENPQDPGDEEQQEQEQEQEQPEPSDEEQDAEPETQEAQPQELHLTREEVMKLLEKLMEIEKEGEQVREQLQRKRRVPVKRDW